MAVELQRVQVCLVPRTALPPIRSTCPALRQQDGGSSGFWRVSPLTIAFTYLFCSRHRGGEHVTRLVCTASLRREALEESGCWAPPVPAPGLASLSSRCTNTKFRTG